MQAANLLYISRCIYLVWHVWCAQGCLVQLAPITVRMTQLTFCRPPISIKTTQDYTCLIARSGYRFQQQTKCAHLHIFRFECHFFPFESLEFFLPKLPSTLRDSIRWRLSTAGTPPSPPQPFGQTTPISNHTELTGDAYTIYDTLTSLTYCLTRCPFGEGDSFILV
jgi:hypothetical protein